MPQAVAPSVLATVDIAIIVGFLILVTMVGFLMTKVASKGLGDYFLGGRRIPWYVLGISTATSNFDMSGTMIVVAVVFSLGLRGFLVEFRGGVGLSLAFLLVFLAKWLRRSRVMTSAEWMKIRFGTDRQGKAAHLLSAIANTILSLGMIIYFAKGSGKFLENFLPVSELTATSMMVLVGLFYTLMSGLYGVVFTDVIQMVLLNLTAIYVTFKAFALKSSVAFPAGFLALNLASPQSPLGASLVHKSPDTWNAILPMFGVSVAMWFFRSTLEGMGGVGGYTDQRFFAAKSEREAGLLTLEAILLSIFRWTMVAGLVVMGYHLMQKGGPLAAKIGGDAEQVLPLVLAWLLPDGVRGFVVAGLIAAAMSTFDSTLNAGASYITRDIYQGYVNPRASDKQLMWASRWATVSLCVAGVGLAAIVPNINKIWGLITMGLGAGLFVPLFLRWYWPRFNGYGFALGTAGGLVSAFVFKASLAWPLYQSFPAIILSALAASFIGALVTSKTDDAVLVAFWLQINPWGPWGRYASLAEERGLISAEARRDRSFEKLNDAVSLAFSVPFQISALLAAMTFVFHAWSAFAGLVTTALFTSLGLYFFWYRNLKDEATCAAEDAIYDAKTRAICEASD